MGHPGHTLEKVAVPDRTETHRPAPHCDACGGFVTEPTVAETRQVFDPPKLGFEVTEHQVFAGQCAVCEEACVRLAPTVALIGQAIQTAKVAHADETGMRVAGKLHWMPALATPMLTWVACHAKRGKEAFDALGILSDFLGTLIHDGWKPYRDLLCKHGLCNAHHLRELIYLFEELGQVWAGRMIELRVAACHEVNEAGGALTLDRVADFRTRYAVILDEGDALSPRDSLELHNPWLGLQSSYESRTTGQHPGCCPARRFKRCENPGPCENRNLYAHERDDAKADQFAGWLAISACTAAISTALICSIRLSSAEAGRAPASENRMTFSRKTIIVGIERMLK